MASRCWIVPSRSISDRPSRSMAHAITIELAPAGIVEQGIEPWPLVAALGAANAGVAVDLDNAPAAAFGDFLERADPILELTDGRC